MKIYISADIEGVTGVTHWDETDSNKPDYQAAREQMTSEVAAACQGAVEAGASEIWVKDSHDTARNIIASRLPREARLVRGWSGHPFMMSEELNASFQAVMLVGYHSGAGAGASPLEHTFSGSIRSMKLNGEYASEFTFDAYCAAYYGVPLVFVSGDKGLCEQVSCLNSHIQTAAVKEGIGDSTINLHPDAAVELIRQRAFQALKGDPQLCRVALPDQFSLQVCYRTHMRAYQFGFYPGAQKIDLYTVQFDTRDYFELMRFLIFALG